VKRTYYIQAEEHIWDYIPSAFDHYHGLPLKDDPLARTWTIHTSSRIGTKYIKAHYQAYTDATYKKPIEQESWNGIMGPIIRAEVGDSITVHFRNNASYPYSIHPHGVKYDFSNEGALYENSGPGSSISPGDSYIYEWTVPARSGPGPDDPTSLLWGYHSHVNDPADVYDGLTGAIIIYKKGILNPKTNKPVGIDQEYVIQLIVGDENQSHYLQENIDFFGLDQSLVDADPDDFTESNKKHNVNGYMFGNLPGLRMRVGEKIRWYIMGWGTEVDLHSLNWHGNTLLYDQHRIDTIELLPAVFRTADMLVDQSGHWLLHCEVGDHIIAGMSAYYDVTAY
jgi:FtsP/CotA-like multicopper oxidase with cupredoxin domain